MFQFNNIPPNIQKTLFKRMNALSRTGNMSPLGLQTEQKSNSVSEMMTKSCWVRVTSAVPDFEKDEKGKYIYPLKKLGHTPMRLSSAYQNGQPLNRPLASKTNLLNNEPTSTLRPHTGVTGVTTSFKNHSIQNVSINWKLWDIEDFEVYEKAFLKHGRTVLVEFGWSTPELKTQPKVEKAEDMLQYYEAIQERIIKGGGDYYAAIGTIKSFQYNIGVNGEFDCSTDLTSMGSTLFKGQVDPSNSAIPELIRNKNTATIEEAFQKTQTNFEKYIKNFNNVIKVYASKNDKGVYYNENSDKGYCTWGWFEDIVLNTFFGFVTKKKNMASKDVITTQVRSIGTKYKVKPYTDSSEVEQFETITGACKCRSNSNLYTKSRHIQFPGRYIGIQAIGEAGLPSSQFDTKVSKKYVHLGETFRSINEFDKFIETNDNPDENGTIRNIVFSADYLAEQFSGIRDLEDGLNSFWNAVNNQYGTFWDFRIVQDQGNNGRIGVIDQLVTENRIKDINPKLDGRKSTISNPNNVFEFPLYSNRSMFKDFSLNVKMSSAMATQAMFHSNKNFGTQGEDTSGKPEDIGITALASMQNQTMSDRIADTQAQEDGKDYLIDEIWLPYLGDPNNNTGPLTIARENPQDKESNLVLKNAKMELGDSPLLDALETQDDTEMRVKPEDEIQNFVAANNWFDPEQPSQKENALVYTADGEMLPSFQKSMLWLMTKSSEAKAQIDPITPLEISFTIPGIGGISMFDLFSVDYLPKQYRDFGLFQVNGMDHTLSPQGWDTKISGLLRVDMDSLIKSAKAAGQYQEGDTTEINTKYDATKTMNVLQFKQNAQKEEKASDSKDKK